MIKIAIDAMGGDFAPKEQIKGTVLALQQDKDFIAVLCGDEERLKAELAAYTYDSSRATENESGGAFLNGAKNPDFLSPDKQGDDGKFLHVCKKARKKQA